MVINDLDICCAPVFKAEAQSPLLVDSNGILPFPVCGQFLQTIFWRNAQIVKRSGCIQHYQLSPRGNLNTFWKFF